MEHTWKEHTASNGAVYLRMDDKPDALARRDRLPQGYLWQFGKKGGFVDTLDEAKAAVEAYAEYQSIPAGQRWLSL
jgi:hypothetical protein